LLSKTIRELERNGFVPSQGFFEIVHDLSMKPNWPSHLLVATIRRGRSQGKGRS
jgi:hypothetical protein